MVGASPPHAQSRALAEQGRDLTELAGVRELEGALDLHGTRPGPADAGSCLLEQGLAAHLGTPGGQRAHGDRGGHEDHRDQRDHAPVGLGIGDDWVGEFGGYGDETDAKVRAAGCSTRGWPC